MRSVHSWGTCVGADGAQDLYAIFEGERNVDSVWSKILQFSGQLTGKAGHLNLRDLAKLKSLFVLTQNPNYNGCFPTGSLARCTLNSHHLISSCSAIQEQTCPSRISLSWMDLSHRGLRR
jgi:hypothetical protein